MRDGSATLHAEQSSGPFNPEIILPTQYFRASTAHTGERRLLVAVLGGRHRLFPEKRVQVQSSRPPAVRRGREVVHERGPTVRLCIRERVRLSPAGCQRYRLRLRRWAQTVVAEGADRAATNSNGQRQPAKKALAAAAARAGFVRIEPAI